MEEKKDFRLIRRYSNRKLYDTHESRYITLLGVAEYVRAGKNVRVVDNESKEDLTYVTLAQIIYEEAKRRPNQSAEGSLRHFIQESREKFLTSLREGPVGKLVLGVDADADATLAEEDKSQESPAKSESESEFDSDAKPEKRHMADISKAAFEEIRAFADDADDKVRAVFDNMFHQAQHEVKRLQQRIEELESKLPNLGRTRKDSPDNDKDLE